ncbi:MAG: DNRLRE domain-containing protein [Gemmatimonadota bacterium]
MRAAWLVAGLAAGLLLAAACSDQRASPVGADLLPGGVLGGALQVATSRDFALAVTYPIFPAGRAEADRVTTSLAWPTAPGFESRALFRFDFAQIDSLPAGTQIADATVRLVYPTPPQPVTLTLHRVTSGWSEDAATWTRRLFGADWSTSGGDFDPEPVARFTIGPGQPDSIRVPVPGALIAGWRSGALLNAGLVLLQETPGIGVDFASRGAEGGNVRGPSLILAVLLPGAGSPSGIGALLAEEDVFIAIDRGGFPPGGLIVSGAEPVRRVFLEPTLASIPAGAAVASAKLILTIASVRTPRDSVTVVAREATTEFRGEQTVYVPTTANTVLGVQIVAATAQPGDTVIFESRQLTRRVRDRLRDPLALRGIGLNVLEESIAFGGVQFHGPEAPLALRPRFRIVFLPPAETGID